MAGPDQPPVGQDQPLVAGPDQAVVPDPDQPPGGDPGSGTWLVLTSQWCLILTKDQVVGPSGTGGWSGSGTDPDQDQARA